MTEPGLAVEAVSFGYVTGRPVLHDVTAEISRGAIVGILGPNGSGKTTLLRLFSGVQRPWRGRVALDGVPLAALGRTESARRIAVVPQDTHLAFDYTVLEMAIMGRYPHLATFAVEGPEDIALARGALAATGTLDLESRLFNTLSGGEKQRVVIAAALAQLGRLAAAAQGRTEVLLLDEPTASLDPAYQLEIRSILLELHRSRELTIVISSHDLNLAAGLCDRLILLQHGRVLASGPLASTLTPDLVRELYGVEADITTNARTGRLTVVPVARARLHA